MLDIGTMLAGPQSAAMGAGLGGLIAGTPGIAPGASGAGGGIGGLLTGLQNPSVALALLQASQKLLNPSVHGTGAQISDALNTGFGTYLSMEQAGKDRKRKAELEDRQYNLDERKVGQGDRGLDIQQKQVDGTLEQGEKKIDIEQQRTDLEGQRVGLAANQQKIDSMNFMDRMELEWARYGLDKDQLDSQKELWKAQAEHYGAEAEVLKAKAKTGQVENLTGEERIINNFATILKNSGVPEDQAYVQAFDMAKQSGGDKYKAISTYTTNMAFLAQNEKTRPMYEAGLKQLIDGNSGTAAEVYDQVKANAPAQAPANAPATSKVDAAIDGYLQQKGLTWDQLPAEAKAKLLDAAKQKFESAGQPFDPVKYK